MDSQNRLKLVIDTDCGIDDALALMFALTDKERADVIAITCCFGNTSVDNACSNVMRVLTVCGEKTIPIHRGCAGPLDKGDSDVTTVHGSDGLGDCAKDFSTGDLKVDETPGPVALINLAKKYPKDITLIAIGPLTNLAIAHRIDETFTENLKSIVIMGGNYKGIGNTTEVAEFNFFCDPLAANIVLTEAICPITLVPWETTMDYAISWDTYKEMIAVKSPKGYFMRKITEFSKLRTESMGRPKAVYDCDFLAVVAVLHPICIKGHFTARANVELKGKRTRGMMVILKAATLASEPNKIDIITDFDIAFVDMLRKNMLME